MPETIHSSLTGTELHEPKGVDNANSNQVYVTNGSGSGVHSYVNLNGWELIEDTATSTIPITLNSVNSKFNLTNNGLGSNTNVNFIFPSQSRLWNSTNNEIELSNKGLQVGDLINIRTNLSITTTNAQTTIELGLDIGNLGEIELPFICNNFRTAGTNKLLSLMMIPINNTSILNNVVKIWIRADTGTTNSVVVNDFLINSIIHRPYYSTT